MQAVAIKRDRSRTGGVGDQGSGRRTDVRQPLTNSPVFARKRIVAAGIEQEELETSAAVLQLAEQAIYCQ